MEEFSLDAVHCLYDALEVGCVSSLKERVSILKGLLDDDIPYY
jgi:hypothetical protein